MATDDPHLANFPEELSGLVRRASMTWPDKVAWVFPSSGETLTFADIDSGSDSIAELLHSLGVAAGDRVAIMLPNVPHFPLTWLAIAKLGAIMVPVNIHYRSSDAGFILEHSTPKVVVTSSRYVDLVSGAYPRRHIIVVTDQPVPEREGVVGLANHRQEIDDIPSISLYRDSVVNIQYTSGTTGHPKGCMLTHYYWMVIAELFANGDGILGVSRDDVMLTAQPFYYIDPQWNVAVSLLTGARLVVLDRFHPATFWGKIREHRVTWFYCLGLMPTLLLQMPTAPEDHDHSVRVILSSGIPTRLHEKLEQRWGVPWFEVYGMTETGLDIRVGPIEHDELVGSGCIGRPLAHREVRIIDEQGQPVERGQEGELLLRGIAMMERYFRNDQATTEVFRDGWLHTGDIVRMDGDGRIFFIGRKKEFIRRSGENISAAEVEEVIKLHDAIEMVAVVGAPDDLRGEEVKAFVVPRNNNIRPEPEELARFCGERLAYFKVPRYWIFCDDLPRTPSERVAKQRLLTSPYVGLPVYDVPPSRLG